VNYSINDSTYTFDFVDSSGATTTRTYNKPAPSPSLYSVNNSGLATGYLTRVRGTQQLTEQFVQQAGGQATPIPIDMGPAGDQVFLIL